MPQVTLLTGGARSGKSAHALELASAYGRRAFIATAEPFDNEMRLRIARHQDERGADFETIEEPVELAGAVHRAAARADVAVVDCLTVWLGNLMHRHGAEREVYPEIEELEAALQAPPLDLILVTNEVGMGIVPVDAFTRRYRDLLGGLNRRIAVAADKVVFLVSGIPMVIKSA